MNMNMNMNPIYNDENKMEIINLKNQVYTLKIDLKLLHIMNKEYINSFENKKIFEFVKNQILKYQLVPSNIKREDIENLVKSIKFLIDSKNSILNDWKYIFDKNIESPDESFKKNLLISTFNKYNY